MNFLQPQLLHVDV